MMDALYDYAGFLLGGDWFPLANRLPRWLHR